MNEVLTQELSVLSEFSVIEDDPFRSRLMYRNATLNVDMKEAGGWDNRFEANVDIAIGIGFRAEDNALKMAVTGDPELVIKSYTNDSGLPLGDVFLDLAFDWLLGVGLPLVARTDFTMDLPENKVGVVGGKDLRLHFDTVAITAGTLGAHVGFNLDAGFCSVDDDLIINLTAAEGADGCSDSDLGPAPYMQVCGSDLVCPP